MVSSSISVRLGGRLYEDALDIYRDIVRAVSPEWVHWRQCIEATGSMVANIAEANGKHRDGGKYYQNFMLHARGSAFEAVAWLEMGVVLGAVLEEEAHSLGEKLLELGECLLREVVS